MNANSNIPENLSGVLDKIRAAAAAAGRSPGCVELVAVSKPHPSSSIDTAVSAGQKVFGENKVQEALDKWKEIKLKNSDIRLHLIGKLQTNKVKFALNIFDYIHSVDSKKLAKKIADLAQHDDCAPKNPPGP